MAARLHIPPTIYLRDRKVESPWWTDRDTQMMRALAYYEAGLCPGGNHVLAETSRPEHEDAYRPGEKIRCFYCKALAAVSEVQAKDEDSAGVLTVLELDPALVNLNLQPAPPPPTAEQLQERQAAEDALRIANAS